MMEHEPITVQELITLLSEQPPNAVVFTEGCDCEGEADGITPVEEDGSYPAMVMITRHGRSFGREKIKPERLQ